MRNKLYNMQGLFNIVNKVMTRAFLKGLSGNESVLQNSAKQITPIHTRTELKKYNEIDLEALLSASLKTGHAIVQGFPAPELSKLLQGACPAPSFPLE
jgi:hypothetical protein